jgi:hypothetical protein
MFKISKRASCTLSQILTAAVFVLLTAALFLLPQILRFFIEVFGKPESYFLPTVLLLYAALPPAFAADIALHLLLRRVRADMIFTEKSVVCLRVLSWCCMLEAVIFFALGFWYYMIFLLSFAALFMGVILRVVKNVIEEASAIKAENDFTI